MILARTVVLLAFLMFGVLGIWLLLAPTKLEDWVGIVASSSAATTELRALYGGLEIGLAIFMLIGFLHPPMAAASCLCLAIVMTCIALARSIGFLLDGSASITLTMFLASEILFAILGFVGFALANRA